MSIVTHDEAQQVTLELGSFSPRRVKVLTGYITQQRTREAEQQTEIERLRGVLQRIASRCPTDDKEYSRASIGDAARAALNTEGAKG